MPPIPGGGRKSEEIFFDACNLWEATGIIGVQSLTGAAFEAFYKVKNRRGKTH
jgi:hypothetical protein